MSPARDEPHWIRETLERFERPLLAYAARILGDLDAARDVVQETFLALCRAERSAVEASLAEWLFRVCRNKALDVKRKERPMKAITETQEREARANVDDPSARLETQDSFAHVLETLERLPEKQQEALRLKFQHGLSYKEIASVTEQSIGNVGFLIHVGLKALRERLSNEMGSAPSMEGKAS